MSTVDIDEDLYWRNGKPKTVEDIACYEYCCPNQEQIIKKFLAHQRDTLKAELLAKLPMQHRNVGADIGDLRKKGYNQAITEITKIIEKEL